MGAEDPDKGSNTGGRRKGLSRDERLKQALRANLRRRKAQQRARGAAGAGHTGHPPGADTGEKG